MDGVSGFTADIAELMKGWNRYMAQNGLGWRIEYHVRKRPWGPQILTRSYRTTAVAEATVKGQPYRVLVLSREDHTNLVEGFVGQTSVDGDAALVMTDRVADLAMQRIWPLFDEGGRGARSDSENAVADQVLIEARLAIGTDAAQALDRASSVHRELVAEIGALRQKKGCGGTVRIDHVPWDGLSERALSLMGRVASENRDRGCGRLTAQDAERIASLSQRLHDDPALETALERLSGWLARAVAVHEARHLADDRSFKELGRRPLCRGCPSSMGFGEQSEVSAYLASFATEGLGYMALLQACDADLSRSGPNTHALSFLLPKLIDGGCDGSVPDDLYLRAGKLERDFFGQAEKIELSASFPESLPLTRAPAVLAPRAVARR
jgi:hypothetical protein